MTHTFKPYTPPTMSSTRQGSQQALKVPSRVDDKLVEYKPPAHACTGVKRSTWLGR